MSFVEPEMRILAAQIKDAILLKAKISFDQPSATQIYYYHGPGPDIKGIGDWPNQAYENFNTMLDNFLAASSPDKLVKLAIDLKVLSLPL